LIRKKIQNEKERLVLEVVVGVDDEVGFDDVLQVQDMMDRSPD
jgi:hypothetical protein